jgi:hypothetical protein
MVVVLVGEILHETGFVFGTYPVFVITDFLVREEAQQVGKAMLGKHFPKPWGGLGTESGPE